MYYQKKPKFSGVYSRNNLPNIKNGPRVINLDQLKSIGTHCIALYVNGSNRRTSCSAMYFASFAVAHIPKEIQKFTGNKDLITNIYGMQVYGSIMCGYISIGFIDSVLKGKSLLDYTNLFPPNDYDENDKIILKYFQ